MHGARKVSVWGFVLAICLASVMPAAAAERCVLAEEFSLTFCIDCPKAEAALDSLLKYDFGPDELTVISSLVDYMPPATEEGRARQRYYPPTYNPASQDTGYYTPTAWFDGVDEQTGVPQGIDSTLVVDSLWTIYRDMVQARRAVPSPLTMDLTVEYGARADTGTAHVQLVAVDPIAYQDLHLRMAVVESGVLVNARIINHLMRDYFPDILGVSLTMSQGDTLSHAEAFVIDSAWAAEECHIVVFVQDDTTREVLQAAQAPVVPAMPVAVGDLSVTLAGDDLLLCWPPVTQDTSGNPLAVSHYRIYRDTLAFRDPGSDPFQTTADTFFVDASGAVGDTEKHYFYWITAVSGQKESADSQAGGEFDKGISAGK